MDNFIINNDVKNEIIFPKFENKILVESVLCEKIEKNK